jgi:putative ABC transport system ATP-binding protein
VLLIQRQSNGFAASFAIIILICCLALQFTSLAGLTTANAAFFPADLQLGFALIQTGLLLFSLAAFIKKSKAAAYTALITAVFMLILSVSSIATYYQNQTLGANSFLTLFAWMLLSAFLGLSVFKSDFTSQVPTQPATGADASSYAIQTINVAKDYVLGSNTVPAVKNLDLVIRKGEFVAIMGPSGSGKSTLLNLLGALDKPTAGQIIIDGVDISHLDENQLAKVRNEKIGFVFQAYNLVARSSVTHNMELPALVKGYSKEKRAEKISYLLNTVNLSSKATVKPKTLSGGEQQRIAICRALINDPEIILADEPTGNLDSKTGQAIMDFFRNLNSEKKTTIVIVTHDPEVAKRTDRTIYFRDGTILKDEQRSAGKLP